MKLKNEKDTDPDIFWAGVGRVLVYGAGLFAFFAIFIFATIGVRAARDPVCHEHLMMTK